ncbi:MAG: glycosyltransferase family 4 protein [Chlorobi bacterium]|nr:glycosyltransferase family 4 protein [Chlorobiota bacterium]
MKKYLPKIYPRPERHKPAVMIEVERMKQPFTGLYYFSLHLAENLYRYYGNEFDFTFFKYPGVKLPSHLKSVSRKWMDKIFLYKDLKYDLWHATWQLTKFVPKGKIKFVYTIHDLNFLYTDMPGDEKRRFLNRMQKIIDRADKITAISHYVKNDIEQYLNTRGKEIAVIHNGVELKTFPDFNRPHYRPVRPFLFTLGTVVYKKHFHVLPALLPGTDYELVIAGIHSDPDYLDTIRREARKHGVEDRVSLIGPVTDKEKYWYLKNAEAFLFPSISEGFGLPPVEAMRLGKPVFLSRYTSLPEIGGGYAYYFDNFSPEHMRRVLAEGLKDFKENDRTEAIKRWSLNFTWEEAVRKYTTVYRRVLDGS